MFGLDARIALAIFGALSVITGATLFNAIKQTQVEQWRQHFENIIKASEAYYLDIGKPLTLNSVPSGALNGGDIVKNRESLKEWKGPYLKGTHKYTTSWSDHMSAKIHEDARFQIFLQQKSDWTVNSGFASEVCVVNSLDCVEWISLYAGHENGTANLLKLFNRLDLELDNGDGQLKGKIRYNTGGNNHLMYQGIPHKNLGFL